MVSGKERLKLARSGFEVVVNKEEFKEKPRKRSVKLPTVAGLFYAKEKTCLFCNKYHESKDCITAMSLPLQERIAKITEKISCLKCLPFVHSVKVCRDFIRYHVCSKLHT